MSTFARHSGTSSTSGTTLYTASGEVVLIGIIASNTSASATDYVTITLTDSGAGVTSVITGAPVPVGSTLSVLDGKIVLNSGDVVKAISTNEDLDVTLSMLEV